MTVDAIDAIMSMISAGSGMAEKGADVSTCFEISSLHGTG